MVSGVRSLSYAGPGTASTSEPAALEGCVRAVGAPEALSRSCLNSDFPRSRSCLNSKLPNSCSSLNE
eukprot:9326358-Alexandrium_andersonii.AAC.1